MSTLVLDQFDLQELVIHVGIDALMDEMIRRLRTAFFEYDPSNTATPQRTGFHYANPTGLIEWMPLHQHGDKVLMKLVGYHPESPIRNGMPTIVSTISTYDTQTGHLVSLMDGTFATALRTGAASAIATELLAKRESNVLGLVGCGAQAVTQLHAISRVCEIDTVLVCDDKPIVAKRFADRTRSFEHALKIEPASLDRIGEESDILCTATSVEVGEGPVIGLQKKKAHLHINAVGSDFPGKTEIGLPTLHGSLVCPDFLPQAVIEGECQQLSDEQIGPTIVEIAKSPATFEPYREKSTVFDSTGWALEDWVASELLLQMARENGFGRELGVEYLAKDPRNPYEFLQSPQKPLVGKATASVK